MKTPIVFSLLLAGATICHAAVLTSIPVGSMIHANIGFNAVEQRLYAHVDPIVPKLLPLDVTNPADNFDPAAEWYSYLDPSQRGMAYSRQYGLVVDASSDPIPAEMGIAFKLINKTPGLEFFTYRASGVWDPILGTEGSTNRLDWDLRMVHPGIAAPAGTNSHSAVLEAFAVNPVTGSPLAGIAPAQFTLEWSNTPSVRTLAFMQNGTLCWSARATNYVLETATTLPAQAWTPVQQTPEISGDECRLPVPMNSLEAFFRLRRVP